MKIITSNHTNNPLHNPSGEIIYEIFGKQEHLGDTKNHGLAEAIIPPGKSSEKHFHKKTEETYYILSGTGRIIIDEKTHTLNTGDLCLIMPGETHQMFNDNDVDVVFLAISAPAWDKDDEFLVK